MPSQNPAQPTTAARRCRRKFLRFFPKGFHDRTYLAWERDYKSDAHLAWKRDLGRARFGEFLEAGDFATIAALAVKVESRTNLIFSYEKMALRDALRSHAGARAFATGLYDFLYGPGDTEARFERWLRVVDGLPRKQSRVLTWPLVTVFGFIAEPKRYIFLKPTVTKVAAAEYGFDFTYTSRPSWPTYAKYLEFAELVRRDTADLRPRDMIDLQSFIWVQGSDEYDE